MSVQKPMLAVQCGDDLDALQYPLLASPKIDGIRAIAQGGHLVSRKLKDIPNIHVQALLQPYCHLGLDGELVTYNEATGEMDPFGEVSSKIMSRSAPITGGVQLLVFDTVDTGTQGWPFADRLATAAVRIAPSRNDNNGGLPPLQLVEHTRINNSEELLRFEDAVLNAGFEGVMLRKVDGPYKQGRSTLREGYLLKLKRFSDDEAVIVGFIEQQRNLNPQVINGNGRLERGHSQAGKVGKNTLGTLVVHHKKFGEFEIGSGLSDGLRDLIWKDPDSYRGLTVKFKYQAHGMKDKPRHPVLLGFRDPRDMS